MKFFRFFNFATFFPLHFSTLPPTFLFPYIFQFFQIHHIFIQPIFQILPPIIYLINLSNSPTIFPSNFSNFTTYFLNFSILPSIFSLIFFKFSNFHFHEKQGFFMTNVVPFKTCLVIEMLTHLKMSFII